MPYPTLLKLRAFTSLTYIHLDYAHDNDIHALEAGLFDIIPSCIVSQIGGIRKISATFSFSEGHTEDCGWPEWYPGWGFVKMLFRANGALGMEAERTVVDGWWEEKGSRRRRWLDTGFGR
jgi:hypothetical protein